jgi:hypothetical protein
MTSGPGPEVIPIGEHMGRRSSAVSVARMPKSGCAACHGFGVVRLTAHFHTGDREWEAPCWECFGRDVKLALPSPQSSEM